MCPQVVTTCSPLRKNTFAAATAAMGPLPFHTARLPPPPTVPLCRAAIVIAPSIKTFVSLINPTYILHVHTIARAGVW